MNRISSRIGKWVAFFSVIFLCLSVFSEEIMLFDFRQGTHGWNGNNIKNFHYTAEDGLVFSGVEPKPNEGPFVFGPATKRMPLGVKLKVTFRMRSNGDHVGLIRGGREWNRFKIAEFQVNPDGQWHDYEARLPAQDEGGRLRIDPAEYLGDFALQWIKVEAMPSPWTNNVPLPAPVPFNVAADAESLEAGGVRVRHDGKHWNGFEVIVNGVTMASSMVNDQIGYAVQGQADFQTLEKADVSLSRNGSVLIVTVVAKDKSGGSWTLRREFRPHEKGLGIEVETSVEVDEDRDVFHMPWMTLFPGFGTFATNKTQAILPGVDYLGENELSSSERSFNENEANRRIVASYKLTSPYMALVHENRYVGLAWDRSDDLAAVFDSPDRMYNSGAHLMSLWSPGVGPCRFENEISNVLPVRFKAHIPQSVTVQIFGGEGNAVGDVSRHVVQYHGLPDVPEFDGGKKEAIRLLADGWLDSVAQNGDGMFMHAVWMNQFDFKPTGEAPAQMLWLAAQTDDRELSDRLRARINLALEKLGPDSNYGESVGHVPRPAAPLLFGRTERFAEECIKNARNQMKTFDEDGVMRFKKRQDKPDFSKTYWTDHANGYSFRPVQKALELAAFSGDEKLIADVLKLLDQQTALYAGTVPRGGQTWEVPLHAPDLFADALMISSYVLGYQLTGNEEYLNQARAWAWAGLPFIYLDAPVDGKTGAYASLAVIGSTRWVGVNWVGKPVQWCGLVYRTALHELAGVDPENREFWNRIGRGITASGLNQTITDRNPARDGRGVPPGRRGLLADWTWLNLQFLHGAVISPATVQTDLSELYDLTPMYRCGRLDNSNIMAFVPGRIQSAEHANNELKLAVDGWSPDPYIVRLTRLPSEPVSVKWNGQSAKVEFNAERKTANITVSGSGILEMDLQK